MFFKVGVLENSAIFAGKYLCWSLFLIKLHSVQVFSCAYCEIFKNRVFYRTTPAAASDISRCEISIVKLRKQRIKECLIINNICQKTCHINPNLGGGGGEVILPSQLVFP